MQEKAENKRNECETNCKKGLAKAADLWYNHAVADVAQG